jgi:glycyl-tRNA synthetase beta subunit
VQILIARGISFDLRRAIDLAVGLQPVPAAGEVRAAVFEFVMGRLRALLGDSGLRHDVVEAAVVGCGQDPRQAEQVARHLKDWVQKPDWPQILAAYARCVRISRDFQESFTVDPRHFASPAEEELWKAVERLEAQVREGTTRHTWTLNRFLESFVPMIPSISRFFEDVLVMTEDESLRRNRLGVLQHISRLPRGWADLSQLEGF